MKYVIVETYKTEVLKIHPTLFASWDQAQEHRGKLALIALALRVDIPKGLDDQQLTDLWRKYQHELPHYHVVELPFEEYKP